MIKAILFDLDGTLIDTNELIFQSFKHTLKKHLNLEPSKDEITRLYGEPLWKSLSRYDDKNVEELMVTYRSYNDLHHDNLCKGFYGVGEALMKLKNNGIKIAIVTSKRRKMADRGLNLLNLSQYIDVIITPEDTEKHKPEAEPALKACKLLGVSPKEAIMVGDSFYDILCGKNAGCLTCAVKYTTLSMELIKSYNPEYFIDGIEELLEVIAAENKKEEYAV